MDQRKDVQDFLTSRRSRLTPQQAGLPVYGTNRRVSGLRREEVALLAGVSVDYYTRLERGNLNGVSSTVLDALARALQLDEAERDHLFDLAETANTARRNPPTPATARVRPNVQRVLDCIAGAPAWVQNDRLDVLAANLLARALYSEMFARRGNGANFARFIFLNPAARQFYPDWDGQAEAVVAILRGAAARSPHEKRLTALVGELATSNEEFRTRWAAHNVRHHHHGSKTMHHPAVGQLELAYEGFPLPADPGLTLFIITAEPASPSADRLALLTSWAATHEYNDQHTTSTPPPLENRPVV